MPIPEDKLPKELMVISIGIIVTIIGWTTECYTKDFIMLILTGITKISVLYLAYDKVKVMIDSIRNGYLIGERLLNIAPLFNLGIMFIK